MNLENLLNKPLWQMTGEEFLFLSKNAQNIEDSTSHPKNEEVATDAKIAKGAAAPKYVFGISGIAQLFGCSIPTANRIKKSGKIDKAIKQIGRKIVVDAELALELAARKSTK